MDIKELIFKEELDRKVMVKRAIILKRIKDELDDIHRYRSSISLGFSFHKVDVETDTIMMVKYNNLIALKNRCYDNESFLSIDVEEFKTVGIVLGDE